MNIELTDLIISQIKTIGTMMAAGILVAFIWNIKIIAINRSSIGIKRRKLAFLMIEAVFWIAAAIIIPTFLYYCTYGKVTFCAVLGLSSGVFLWKIFINKVFK